MDFVSYRTLWEMVGDAQQKKPESCRQILMTCQRLYHEGLPFFCENRLEIAWSPATTGQPSGLTGYFCDILDGSKLYGTCPDSFQIDHDELDLSSVSSASDTQDTTELQLHHKTPYLKHQAQQLNKLAPIISKFTKFHVRVELLDWADESVLAMCRALRGILEGCNVTIETHDLPTYNGSEEFMPREHWLKYFRILRCKSLEILGRSELFLGCEVESLDEVIRLVTSDEPVQDIFRRWRSLCTSGFAPLPTEPYHEDFEEEVLSIPVDEICEYDAQEFEEWRDEAFQRLGDKGFDRERLRKMVDEDSQAIRSG